MSRWVRAGVGALRGVRSTYWFVPAVITIGAVVLSIVLTNIETTDQQSVWLGWAYGGGADGARALLSAVAGSMITVVSVTFSVMVVALTVSSQHFGPRLLRSFMRDRPAQVVLGTFTGTFAYCLMVLRTVQGDGGDRYDRFVPHVAVAMGVVLALVAVGALIFYVHHIALSMQVTEITRRIGMELDHAIGRLYPDPIGAGSDDDLPPPPRAPADSERVAAAATGFVQVVDDEALFRLAGGHHATIWLHARPGDFVTRGETVAQVSAESADPAEIGKAIQAAYTIGAERSLDQDAGFAVQQLVEIALRALSPGVNEPFTALTAIDWLAGPLAALAERRLPAGTRRDETGTVRVVTTPRTLAELLRSAFEPIARDAGRNVEVCERLLDRLTRLAAVAQRPADRETIAEIGDTVWAAAAREIEHEPQRVRLASRHAMLRKTLNLRAVRVFRES